MSQNDTVPRRTAWWKALPSLMLGLGFVLNVAWLGILAWGVFQLAEWALS